MNINSKIPEKIDQIEFNEQEMVNEAINLLVKLSTENPIIEPRLWVSAFITCIVRAYANSEISFKDFEKEMKVAILFHKHKFDE